MDKENKENNPNWERIQAALKENVKVLHEELGWFNNEELENTPIRISKFYNEWYNNTQYNKFTTFENGGEYGCNVKYNGLVTLNNITVNSMCSHHMLGFSGIANIAYLPGKNVIGVSKLSRIVKKIASRPQIQEGLTAEIANDLFKILEPEFLCVMMKAKHTCMTCRGVGEHNTQMVTSEVRYSDNYKDTYHIHEATAMRMFEEK